MKILEEEATVVPEVKITFASIAFVTDLHQSSPKTVKGRNFKEQKKTELRIVEDAEPPEPIARLEVTEKVKGFTPGKVSLDYVDSPMAVPEEKIPEQSSGAIPPAFLALAALLFFGLLGYGAWLLLTGKDENKVRTITSQTNLAEKMAEEQTAIKLIENIRTTLENYLGADSVEEKAKWVRHPERVKPLMEAYYQTHDLEPRDGVKFLQQHPFVHGESTFQIRSFMVLMYKVDDGPEEYALAENTADGKVLIDWEAVECYQPIPVERFLNERPTSPVVLRVRARTDNFYIYDFKDSEKYQCIRLSFRDYEDRIYAYVENDSEVAEKLKRHILDSDNPQGEPCLLKLRYKEGSHPSVGPLIVDFLAESWIYIDNPVNE